MQIEVGSLVRLIPSAFPTYRRSMEFWSHLPFPENSVGIVSDFFDDRIVAVEWLPLGLYPCEPAVYVWKDNLALA